jgi:hypothetical protein
MKRVLPNFALIALVLCAAPVLADAPIGQYEPFIGSTTTIRDSFTKLEWERNNAPRTKRLWASAQGSACSTFGRLPTVKELLTLVDEQPHSEYEFGKTVQKTIDQNAFGDFTAEDAPYWTSTPTDVSGERWGVSFRDGTMARLKENDATGFYVRCVK